MINFDDNVSSNLIKLIAILFLLLGIFNFIYNVFFFAQGNIINYLTYMSIRKLEFDEFGGTTLWYNFYYVGTFLLLYVQLKIKGKISFFFLLLIIIGIIIRLSTGRISSTLFYMMSLMAIYYYYKRCNHKISNKKYFMILGIVILGGLIFFFYRLIGNLIYNYGRIDFSILLSLLNDADYLIIDSGNIPNTPLMIKIIDSWELDHGYLYGESFFTWVLNGLPASIKPENYQPSTMIKQLWFAHVPGGNLPPTIVGEMYMNFGIFGIVFGMFIIGMLLKLIRNFVIKRANILIYTAYASIFIPFAFILPKGEMDNLSVSGFLFGMLPFLILRFLRVFKYKHNLLGDND